MAERKNYDPFFPRAGTSTWVNLGLSYVLLEQKLGFPHLPNNFLSG